MSHLHFPDGILPIWLWVAGYAVIAGLLALSLWYLSRSNMGKRIPLIAVLSAMMIVGMSFEIVALAYHVNLAIPTGIILGPAGAIIAAFVTNLFLALVGHGGITVVGLNSLLLSIEAVVGYVLFYYVFKFRSLFWRAATSTLIALMVSSILAVTLTIYAAPSQVAGRMDEVGSFLEHGSPLRLELGSEKEAAPATSQDVNISGFLTIALGLGAIGWVIESLLSGFVISYIGRVKPDLVTRR